MKYVWYLPLLSFFIHGLAMTVRMIHQKTAQANITEFTLDLGIKLEYITIPILFYGQLAEWSKAHAWNACKGQPF